MKCTVIVRLFNFLTALWTKYPKDTLKAIDSSFYSDDLTRLILICVLNPTQLGFDINNEEINKKLPERVRLIYLSQEIENQEYEYLDFKFIKIHDYSSVRTISSTVQNFSCTNDKIRRRVDDLLSIMFT